MTVDERTREALLATYLHPLALCDRRLTRRGVASALDRELGRLDDDDWNTRYHGAVGIGTPADYRHRLVETRRGAVLCSIHFYKGERDKPFVELIARTNDAVTWGEAARVALDAHAVFAPTRARFMHAGGAPPEAGAGRSLAPDQRFVLGEACTMRRAAADAWDDRLTLERASVDDAEGAMDEAYAQRALSRELDDDAVVVGTIDDRNRASLRTAQRAGRTVVASWWFLSPGA